MRAVKKFFCLSLLIVLFGSGLWFFSLREINQHPGGRTEAVLFVVNEGEGAAVIAGNLARQKLVSSSYLMRFYLMANHLTGSLQAGVFKIPVGASIKEIAEILRYGHSDIKLTFIEGWRREEMAKYLNSKLPARGGSAFGGKSQSANWRTEVDFGEEFLKETEGLEGYLFPDTYYIPTWFTPRQLVEVMQDNREKRFEELRPALAEFRQMWLPWDEREVTILASVVEREVKLAEDRPWVAGILLKRLESDWPLEADATLQYAMANRRLEDEGWKREDFDFWPKRITAEDLKLDSPYNTRRYAGLPPTPIGNPGLAALRAVVFAEKSPYWFYLSDKTGKMHYARTLEEHSQNMVRYLAE